MTELLSLSCIFSINPMYVLENYFSGELGNKLRRNNVPDKYIQNMHITVPLCNLPSMSQPIVQVGRREKPFFDLTWLFSSFMCSEKIFNRKLFHCGQLCILCLALNILIPCKSNKLGIIPKGLCHQACNGLHVYQQTASATSGGSSHTGTAVFPGADKAFVCFVSPAYPVRVTNYFITWIIIINT